MILSAPGWIVPALFSPNLTRSLINQSKDGERFLHAAAVHSLKAIKTRAQKDPSSAALLFIAMTSKHGALDFDKVTKTKTLEQILLAADDEALEKIVDHLQGVILRPGSDESSTADLRRRLVADMLLNIVKGYSKYDTDFTSLGEEGTWLHKLLSVFVEHSYFVPTESAKTRKMPLPPISESSRKIFQERLSSSLGRLLVVGKDVRVSFPFLVVSMIQSRGGKHLEPVFKADKSVMKTIEKAHKSLELISTEVSFHSGVRVLKLIVSCRLPNQRVEVQKDLSFSIPLRFYKSMMETETRSLCWKSSNLAASLLPRKEARSPTKAATPLSKFSLRFLAIQGHCSSRLLSRHFRCLRQT